MDKEVKDSSQDDLLEQSITALQEQNWERRIEASIQLSLLNNKRAIEPLVNALEDENLLVRQYIVASLAIIGDNSVLPNLKKRQSIESDPTIKYIIKTAIERIEQRQQEN